MKPAIFNTAMVRAILALIKKNTRRPFSKYLKKVIDAAYAMGEIGSNGIDSDFDNSDKKYLMAFAPYKVGEIIYVRETFIHGVKYDENDRPLTTDDGSDWIWKTYYRADDEYLNWVNTDGDEINPPWKPSIHMPKEYARLFLRVKDVRIERLNEISADDACKEGLDWRDYWCDNGQSINDPREWFKTLWESIYGNGSFDNRYVWVIEFEKISKEEAING